ncbi:hypothetical protein SAMN05421796_10524 [Chryseobacterium piscicola]|uniref:Uncharacterized protein n=1 Tax=Chryseobacterium piscicola TaxID=551459 RepID=A0A1N7ML14_9FLAO|nr:hypothetical protein SAMN05421796_10524 [Chryseobacterium piscicola]
MFDKEEIVSLTILVELEEALNKYNGDQEYFIGLSKSAFKIML